MTRTRLDWPHDRCILCLTAGPLTYEHIIPGFLGGRLQVRFLCGCNSKVGSREAVLKSDPSIRLAIEHLKDQIPGTAASVIEGQPFFAESPRGKVRGIVKRQRFQISASREPDGSWVQPTKAGRKTIAAWLSEQHEAAEVERLLRQFDEAPDDTAIDLGPSIRAIKWSHGDPRPALGGRLVDDGPILKIAYEFLACHLMGAIYHLRFDDIRAAILGRPGRSGAYRIERLRGEGYAPMHGLALEAGTPYIIVQVRFFGWLAFRVHFLRVAWGGPRYVYTLDLIRSAGYCKQIADGSAGRPAEEVEPAPQ